MWHLLPKFLALTTFMRFILFILQPVHNEMSGGLHFNDVVQPMKSLPAFFHLLLMRVITLTFAVCRCAYWMDHIGSHFLRCLIMWMQRGGVVQRSIASRLNGSLKLNWPCLITARFCFRWQCSSSSRWGDLDTSGQASDSGVKQRSLAPEDVCSQMLLGGSCWEIKYWGTELCYRHYWFSSWLGLGPCIVFCSPFLSDIKRWERSAVDPQGILLYYWWNWCGCVPSICNTPTSLWRYRKKL